MKTNDFTALLKIHWKLILRSETRSQNGFSLTELLVASFIGIVVILAGGYFLKTNLDVDRVRAANSAQRNIQSRALDYIANDLRRANAIVDPSSRSCNGVTPVLSIRIPNPQNVATSVVVDYSVATPSAPWPTANNARAIYRCGPEVLTTGGSAGEYNFGSTTTDLLVDQIANANPTGNGVCSNLNAAALASPFASATTRGTNGLVVRSETTNPRSAQVLIAFQRTVGNAGSPAVDCVTNVITARAIEVGSSSAGSGGTGGTGTGGTGTGGTGTGGTGTGGTGTGGTGTGGTGTGGTGTGGTGTGGTGTGGTGTGGTGTAPTISIASITGGGNNSNVTLNLSSLGSLLGVTSYRIFGCTQNNGTCTPATNGTPTLTTSSTNPSISNVSLQGNRRACFTAQAVGPLGIVLGTSTICTGG